jgi:hypothetical protein
MAAYQRSNELFCLCNRRPVADSAIPNARPPIAIREDTTPRNSFVQQAKTRFFFYKQLVLVRPLFPQGPFLKNMKTLLTILFFADTLVLIVLSFFLLKMLDTGVGAGWLTFLLVVYACCIFLLGYLLFRYMNLPPDKKRHSFFE